MQKKLQNDMEFGILQGLIGILGVGSLWQFLVSVIRGSCGPLFVSVYIWCPAG